MGTFMNQYIAIEFEAGSGGTEIAEGVAESLAIPCYGRDMLKMVAKEMSLTEFDIRNYVESITDNSMYSRYIISQIKSGQVSGLPHEGQICLAHRNTIRRLAEIGSAVFVGQCAADVIEDLGKVTQVFIKAGNDVRKNHIAEKTTALNCTPDELMKRLDGLQERYYFSIRNKPWRDPDNYDLVLDSSQIGAAECIIAIKQEFTRKTGKAV